VDKFGRPIPPGKKVMRKMLRQVFGVWTTGQAFNPQHEAKNQQKQETSGLKDESGALEEPTGKEVTEAPASLEPVSPKAVEPPSHSAPTNAPTQARRPIDYRALREQISLQQVLERVSPAPIHNAQHRGPCPLHEPNATNGRNFSANLKRQVFRCFDSECRATGSVLDFWKAYRRMDVYEAAEDLAKTFQIEVPYRDDNTSQSMNRKGEKTGGHHPPSP